MLGDYSFDCFCIFPGFIPQEWPKILLFYTTYYNQNSTQPELIYVQTVIEIICMCIALNVVQNIYLSCFERYVVCDFVMCTDQFQMVYSNRIKKVVNSTQYRSLINQITHGYLLNQKLCGVSVSGILRTVVTKTSKYNIFVLVLVLGLVKYIYL